MISTEDKNSILDKTSTFCKACIKDVRASLYLVLTDLFG